MPIGLNHETETARPGMDSIMEVGSIYGNARSTVPSGYLLCDGSLINRTTYSRLFSVISTTYGTGDGSTTFALPDLRGAVPRGTGTSNGYTQNVTVTLGAKTNDGFGSHNHGGGSHSHSFYVNYTASPSGGSPDAPLYWGNAGNGYHSWGTTNSSGTIISTQGETETRMKNLGVNFFIKF
jgi:microcystin-dependent protein